MEFLFLFVLGYSTTLFWLNLAYFWWIFRPLIYCFVDASVKECSFRGCVWVRVYTNPACGKMKAYMCIFLRVCVFSLFRRVRMHAPGVCFLAGCDCACSYWSLDGCVMWLSTRWLKHGLCSPVEYVHGGVHGVHADFKFVHSAVANCRFWRWIVHAFLRVCA